MQNLFLIMLATNNIHWLGAYYLNKASCDVKCKPLPLKIVWAMVEKCKKASIMHNHAFNI